MIWGATAKWRQDGHLVHSAEQRSGGASICSQGLGALGGLVGLALHHLVGVQRVGRSPSPQGTEIQLGAGPPELREAKALVPRPAGWQKVGAPRSGRCPVVKTLEAKEHQGLACRSDRARAPHAMASGPGFAFP